MNYNFDANGAIIQNDNLADDVSVNLNNMYTIHAHHNEMVRRFANKKRDKEYQIHLRVKKKCEPGQSVVILGQIPQLGAWNKEKPGRRMVWTEGDYWVTDTPIITNKYFFQYKYVLWDDAKNKMASWERGIDRLLDCEVLDDCSGKSQNQSGFTYQPTIGKNSHCVMLEDEIYEAFSTCFTVSFPYDIQKNVMTLISHHESIKTTDMHKGSVFTSWMPNKYGQPMNSYRAICQMENIKSGDNGQWKEDSTNNQVSYEYSMSLALGKVMHERRPTRKFTILDPSQYKGQLGAAGDTLWANSEDVFVVNGYVNKGDGNFELDFRTANFAKQRIVLGSYPENDKDVSYIKQQGCTSSLDIQHFYRSLSVQNEQAMFKRQGFKYTIHKPVSDVFIDEYVRAAFQAACKLENLINQRDQTVFLHCFTGISRAPTILMCYFALFCRHPSWSDIDELYTQVKIVWKYADCNMTVVRMVLDQNRDLHLKSQQRFKLDEERENEERLRELANDKDSAGKIQAEIDKYRKMAEAEAEAIRKQRAKFADDEKVRVKKRDDKLREREQEADDKLQAHIKKMRDLEKRLTDQENARRMKEEQDRIDDDRLQNQRNLELEAARRKLALKQEDVRKLIEQRDREQDEFMEQYTERTFRIEKDMLARYEADLSEQETYDKDRKKKRKEYEEQYQILFLRLQVVREEQIYAELEDEQLIELIQQKELDLERYDELDKRRLLEIEERRKLEADRQKEVEGQIEFEKEQKALFDQLDKDMSNEYEKRHRKVKEIQNEAERQTRELNNTESEERTIIIRLQGEQDSDSKRIQRIGLEESEKIIRRIKELQEEDKSRKQMKRMSMNGGPSPTHLNNITYTAGPINGNGRSFMENEIIDDEINDLGISEDEIEDQMDDLFKDAPIEFRPRKFNNIDQMIANVLANQASHIPVMSVSGTTYVVGSHVVNFVIDHDRLVIERGSGNISFEDFLDENNLKFQRNIVIKMLKSNESLEYVMEQIIQKYHQKPKTRLNQTLNGRSPGRRSPAKGNHSPGLNKNRYFQQ